MLQLVSVVKARLPRKIPDTWISGTFLERCIERKKKGGAVKGTIASYRDEWGRKGVKEVKINFKHSPQQSKSSACLCLVELD
jgi:hypothetical protein